MGLYFVDEAIRRAATARHLNNAAAKAQAGFWEGWREASDLLLLNFRDIFGDEPKDEAAREFLEILEEQWSDASARLAEIYCGDPREL